MFKSTSAKSSQKKKRRFRKNYEQLQKLSMFYSENKHWSKNQIKKMGRKIILKVFYFLILKKKTEQSYIKSQRMEEPKNLKALLMNI